MLFAQRARDLHHRLAQLPSLLVALSGGVDSAVLLGAAARALPGRVMAATTRSAAVPDEEIEEAARVAGLLGIPHRVVATDELSDPDYRANLGDRCYFCRRSMYSELAALADAEGLAHLADGVQADDDMADRPGMRAATERDVLHPLREAGLTKAETRRLARAYGLAGISDKPAQPCLASRIRPGLPVTEERLAMVHRAESALRARGFLELRVRCERSHGRIELGPADLRRARGRAAELEALVVEAGFESAALDPVALRRA